jgi:signal transduction histidine kinase
MYNKVGFHINSSHISFSSYIPEYKWYITAIKDISSIQKDIDVKHKLAELRREENVKTNYYLLIFTWIVSLVLSIYLSNIINRRLKKYEIQLQDSNHQLIFQSRQALLGELLPMIAHQWRQPINKIASIVARLRFIPKNISLDRAELDKAYQDIENNIEFMSDTIDDFREFYQPKRHTTKQNLKELIIKSVDFVDGYIRKKDIQVDMTLEDVDYNLYANEFLQIMINLLKNSIDALPSKGTITIELFKKANHIHICVSDNGKGIEADNINKIFEPYFTTKENSMGLGLYMSKIIIEQHIGGKIHLKRLDKGVMFFITLPL